ncbi:MAG: purine-nucleoside/S-methyl-5-thioadenosine phosphorylase / adenosine deaminase [Gemmatimonadales bacterium]|nr:purine-nucleoside/S-methyl-5-thioadenosine phosphorylase / adenosine deaminase [Gemmatimonadales bacterium]
MLRFGLLEVDGLVHAVTTRAGGVSPAPLDTLNMSWARPDDPANVLENRRRVCAALEIPVERLVQAGQVHDVGVRVVHAEDAGRGATSRASILPPNDGLITDVPDVYLFACFADCVPLLFFDPRRPAVGVAHAGWRGTVAGMAAEMVWAFETQFGTQAADLRVVIGPSIGPCCYQVGPEVIAATRVALPGMDDLFSCVKGDTAHLDLWAANRAFLLKVGVLPDHIETSALCTMEHASDFFSHRATGGDTGRFAAIIGLRPNQEQTIYE